MFQFFDPVLPAKRNRVPVDLLLIGLNAPGQFFLRSHPHVAQDTPGHLRKKHLHPVEPGRMLGRKLKFEPTRMASKPPARLQGSVRGMVVTENTNGPIRRVDGMEFFQKLDELPAPMVVPDDPVDFTRHQVQSGQKRQGPQAHVFMVAPPRRP